jgi:hypothetical protein
MKPTPPITRREFIKLGAGAAAGAALSACGGEKPPPDPDEDDRPTKSKQQPTQPDTNDHIEPTATELPPTQTPTPEPPPTQTPEPTATLEPERLGLTSNGITHETYDPDYEVPELEPFDRGCEQSFFAGDADDTLTTAPALFLHEYKPIGFSEDAPDAATTIIVEGYKPLEAEVVAGPDPQAKYRHTVTEAMNSIFVDGNGNYKTQDGDCYGKYGDYVKDNSNYAEAIKRGELFALPVEIEFPLRDSDGGVLPFGIVFMTETSIGIQRSRSYPITCPFVYDTTTSTEAHNRDFPFSWGTEWIDFQFSVKTRLEEAANKPFGIKLANDIIWIRSQIEDEKLTVEALRTPPEKDWEEE